jgi:hypothetical protein
MKVSITPTTAIDRMITAGTTVDPDTAEALWDLYRIAFAGLRSRAAGRQLLSRPEFILEILDPRVVKYVARSADGRVVGLCTLSNDLATMPWISPEFYRNRYPAHFARRAVFYFGLAVVQADARSSRAFSEMVATLARDVAAANGVLVGDMCRFNADEMYLARTVTSMLERAWGSVRAVELDRQLYLAWEPGDRPAVPRPADAPTRVEA